MKPDQPNWLEANRAVWNKRTDAHLTSEFYDVESFQNGECSLNQFELDLLGNVRGKTLLHLQCHFGQDTLSLARLGAIASGLDFSDSAIEAAKKLNEDLGLDVNFYCADVYNTRNAIDETFDVVFTSYGVVGWLPDLRPWANVISESLNDGGIFVMCEFHPYVWMMDEEYDYIKYSYFNERMIESEVTGSYASIHKLHEPLIEYGWNHPLTDVLNALLAEGLKLEVFNEHDGSPYNCFPGMEAGEDGLYRFTKWENKVPLVYGIRFRK